MGTNKEEEKAKSSDKLKNRADMLMMCMFDLKRRKSMDYTGIISDLYMHCCLLAKDEVLPIFEKKLQELKDELAAL